MFLFSYKCGVVVLYSTLFLFNFLHFRHVSFLMTSTDPGNALYYVFCQNEYWETFTGKIRHPLVTRRVQISKEASSQSKAFCTSMKLAFLLLFFFPLHFFHLFPNLFDVISLPQYQSFSTVLKWFSSQKKPSGSVCDISNRASSVNRKPVYGGKVF